MSIRKGNSIISGTDTGDGKSITRNSNSQLQTIGVIDQSDNNTALKYWSGTKVQYDAIVTKDANTIYNITDDTDVTLTLLNLLYPVGSLYIASGNLSTCPLSVLGVGTWTLKTTTTLVTGVNSTAPVVGNGGSTYMGSTESNMVAIQTGATTGIRNLALNTTIGEYSSVHISTDPTKSGIEANVTSTTLAVTIWERIS